MTSDDVHGFRVRFFDLSKMASETITVYADGFDDKSATNIVAVDDVTNTSPDQVEKCARFRLAELRSMQKKDGEK